ncbi:stage III sporulation protein AF [Virgibacillus natechei]|uniref:Stage III sporulation protein AF n=1 Tax=Virgibacillus natechei TaxID=1216297 RepID=A0ABS4IFK7_9BACI|nr:stage III sporulation protein AF [Virgibacillus natechei]MBP1969715.1 stage III sporulation protein AF [Virgibacillus natechei]UZD11440.1 stage III sporulation protein AF [Virgibacillus natechei]
MDVFIQWVTQIVIFLILAAVIDLIIPSTHMKKYIKLVVGLILILILLQPIFYLFNINIQDELETSFSQVFEDNLNDDSVENLMELQKSEIEVSQDAYILEQMAVQLKDLASDPLLEEHQAEITDVNFLFSSEEDYTYENLEEVIVYLRESDDEEGTVELVEDVEINTDDPIITEEGQDNEQITGLLTQVWELHNKEITIIWEGGTS